jgi:oxaloacetate decarboxylase alpha subunit
LKRYQITVGGRTFDVRVLSDPRQEQVQVEVDGTALTVDVSTLALQRDQAAVSSDPAPPSSSTRSHAVPGGTLEAPLPGEIKSIAVRAGQQVEVGDELLVIEAMKMDNVIRAPRAGTIGTVHVAEGHRIAHGDPLLDFLA